MTRESLYYCATCSHQWHGLPCTHPTYQTETPICNCPGPWETP